ncbi:MAG: helix-hairpin-helix domain-containing protein [Candidatus Thorarchaeota archaeon]|jgi:DNA uptake protein ComE-like DNA-binding protein
MNRFASLTEWMSGEKIIKVRSSTTDSNEIHNLGPSGNPTQIPIATVEMITPEEDVAIHRVNKSNTEDLTEIKGIGPATADKILSKIPYNSFEHLNEMVTLGKKVFKNLQDWAKA